MTVLAAEVAEAEETLAAAAINKMDLEASAKAKDSKSFAKDFAPRLRLVLLPQHALLEKFRRASATAFDASLTWPTMVGECSCRSTGASQPCQGSLKPKPNAADSSDSYDSNRASIESLIRSAASSRSLSLRVHPMNCTLLPKVKSAG